MKQSKRFSSCGSVHDRFPPLSPKYQWFVAQDPQADTDGNGDQFFYNIQDPLSFYRCRIPELHRKRIRGSFHGWLILSNDNMWSLWDPVTSKIMHLPPLVLTDGDSTSIKECLYALNTDNHFYEFVIEIGIVVKDGGVVIKLMLFAGRPDFPYCRGHEFLLFLSRSNTELFCIIIGLKFDVIIDTSFSLVSLHKLDMTSLNWGKLEGLKKWDITGKRPGELEEEEINNMFNSSEIWEQMEDLKDGNFFVDLARDDSVAYSPTIASEFGDNIHIRSRMGKVIYSYNLSDRTILLSSMFPSPLLPTSHVSVWDCRLAADYAKAKQEVGDTVPWITQQANACQISSVTCFVQWRGEVALKRLQNYSVLSPWLMMADEKRGIVTFEDPLYGYKYFMKKLCAPIPDGEVCYSGYGWLLYYSECGLEFCNPFTDEVHDLPKTDNYFYSLCLSAPPTSPDCMVVGFSTVGIFIHIVHGEQTWRLVCRLDNDDDDDDDVDDDGHHVHFNFPTLYGEDLYALRDDGELHVFKNLAQEDLSWKKDVVVKAPRSCCRFPVEYFLTKCDQHLLLVFVDHFGESVEVFKLNDLKNEWEKTNGIGRHMICISDDACLCIEAKSPEMEDKIFFARLYNRNGKVVFYSLKTGMFHTFNAKNIEASFGDFVGTKHYPFCHNAWIEPSWS
ncbi:hypothetical protein Tco_1102301 [Tanacetum coccineum]